MTELIHQYAIHASMYSYFNTYIFIGKSANNSMYLAASMKQGCNFVVAASGVDDNSYFDRPAWLPLMMIAIAAHCSGTVWFCLQFLLVLFSLLQSCLLACTLVDATNINYSINVSMTGRT